MILEPKEYLILCFLSAKKVELNSDEKKQLFNQIKNGQLVCFVDFKHYKADWQPLCIAQEIFQPINLKFVS